MGEFLRRKNARFGIGDLGLGSPIEGVLAPPSASPREVVKRLALGPIHIPIERADAHATQPVVGLGDRDRGKRPLTECFLEAPEADAQVGQVTRTHAVGLPSLEEFTYRVSDGNAIVDPLNVCDVVPDGIENRDAVGREQFLGF
jgi:hypothetical protein